MRRGINPLLFAGVGLIMGYVIWSPFAMYISHIVHDGMAIHDMKIWQVFTPELYRWSVPFMFISATAGYIIGYLYKRHLDYIFKVADALRNPLQSQLGFLEMFDEEELAPEQKSILKEVKNSNRALEEGIKKLT